jgi:uncharacterized protein YdhG (YjbR/CyaY superfamily)
MDRQKSDHESVDEYISRFPPEVQSILERHIGLYPLPSGIEEFKERLSPYKTGKGSVQFPLDAEMPYDLVRDIVRARIASISGP